MRHVVGVSPLHPATRSHGHYSEPPHRLAVLVVDDNTDAVDSLAIFLRLNGYDVRAAYGGEQAMAIRSEWQADIAVLDIVMNGMGGMELAVRLRKGAARPILLVAVTGIGTNDEVARVNTRVFDHFFLKPVDPDELLRVLAAHADRMPPSA